MLSEVWTRGRGARIAAGLVLAMAVAFSPTAWADDIGGDDDEDEFSKVELDSIQPSDDVKCSDFRLPKKEHKGDLSRKRFRARKLVNAVARFCTGGKMSESEKGVSVTMLVDRWKTYPDRGPGPDQDARRMIRKGFINSHCNTPEEKQAFLAHMKAVWACYKAQREREKERREERREEKKDEGSPFNGNSGGIQ